MISLTYLSTATSPFDEEQLSDLLATSRKNNHGVQLSGMLLYAGGHFIQTLEGPEQQVEATFHRIGADPRHRDVIIALRDEIEVRVFGEWSMGFDALDDQAAERLPGFSEFLAARTELVQRAANLGRAGIFHSAFRDNMR